MLLVLDHRDSFTGNLVHLLHKFGEVKVLQSPQSLECLRTLPKALILSPGPGQPKDYPETVKLYRKAKESGIPILGVCLGFQIILYAEGASIVRQPRVLHGVQTTMLCNTKSRIYEGLPKELKVGRYHSLQIDPQSIPSHVHISAWNDDQSVPLSLEMNSPAKIAGLQYHPESFLTPNGENIVKNILG